MSCPSPRFRSVGWLLDEDDDGICLAATLGENGQATGHITIPKCAITGRWEIVV